MAVFRNFDINSFSVPLWVYLLVVVVGIVAPLVAAAYPVWKGSGISVREALADFGVGQQAFGDSSLDRALAGVGGMTRPLLLAIRNSFRRRARSEQFQQSRWSLWFDQHMVMIYILLIVMSCILAGVGGLGLMTAMSLNVLERRREMGVLRAIGASPKLIWLIVVAEGAVIGLLSWGLAAIAAWPVSKAIGNLLVRLAFKSGLGFLFEFRGVLIWLAVSIVLCVAASFLSAWNASRRSVREAIGYE